MKKQYIMKERKHFSKRKNLPLEKKNVCNVPEKKKKTCFAYYIQYKKA